MDKLLGVQIIRALKTAGFDSFNKRAVSMFVKVVEEHINSQLVYLSSIAGHSQKAKVTFLDTIKFTNLSKININEIDFASYEQNNLLDESEEEEICFENPIASAIEKYIHIYEFMPDFPPTHTFKKTYSKELKKENKASKLKKQLEQSALAEKKVIHMLKVTGKLPKYVNFREFDR